MPVSGGSATLMGMPHEERPCHDCDVAEPVRPLLPVQAGTSRGERWDRQATQVEFVRCPECDGIASVEWRSTARAEGGGPVGHAKVRCITGHWFLVPTAWLVAA